MPDLQRAYIYEDWILDLALAHAYKEFTRFDLFHQCEVGVIRRTKGVLKDPDVEPPTTNEDWTVACTGCQARMTDAQLRQMMAMWKLVVMTRSEV